MYFQPRYTVSVRDGQGRYRRPPSTPFPAGHVLDDLRHADGAEVPHIVARYTALRWWILTATGAEPVLVDHARTAARDHLAAVEGEDWSERAALEGLLDTRRPGAAAALLEAAAEAAAASGHRAGARSLLSAAVRARAARDPDPNAA